MTRVKAWFCNSLTVFWARAQLTAGALLTIATQVAEIMQAANVTQYMPPKWAPLALMIMGVVTEVARRRKEWQS